MNTRLKLLLAPLALVLTLAGCATSPSLPRISYPVTYQIQVGNTQVASSYGPQNLNQVATQAVAAEPGVPLYFQIVSPVVVTVTVSEVSGQTRRQLSQMQGTNLSSYITPATRNLEFAFSASQANSSGTIQFSLSDRPLPPAPAAYRPPGY